MKNNMRTSQINRESFIVSFVNTHLTSFNNHSKKLNQFLTVCKGHHNKAMTVRKQQKSLFELEKPA
jgi:hypothetical protein